MQLFDAHQQPVTLGPEIGRGGEGIVYQLVERPDRAAKIYSRIADADRVAKLACMVEMWEENPALADWCAWPQEMLRDQNGACRGFLMPHIDQCHPVHDVYNPEQRKTTFPHARWDFLVRAATNCARMFASLHRVGVIVGDVNERNLLIGRDATVQLVDCDSFQIVSGDQLFRTGVGVPDYTPPELQGADFRGIARTVDHDRFGLAVIVFKLLFMGRHPFSGGASGELAAAIRDYKYDYADLTARLRHLVPLEAVSQEVESDFAATFAPPPPEPAERPSAETWYTHLKAFEDSLQDCPNDSLHVFLRDALACPWCDIESALHYAYFDLPPADAHVSVWRPRLDEMAALQGSLVAVEQPTDPNSYTQSVEVLKALDLAQRLAAFEAAPDVRSWYVRVAGGMLALSGAAMLAADAEIGGGLMLCGGALWAAGLILHRRMLRPQNAKLQRLKDCAQTLRSVEDEWRGEAYRFREHDRRQRGHFEQMKEQFEGLGRYRLREIARLRCPPPPPQMYGYLRQHEVESARVPGLSAERKRALLVRGLLTAAELDREVLQGVPVLTSANIDALLKWRDSLVVKGGGQPRAPATAAQLAAVDANCLHIQENLLTEMRALIRDLRVANRDANTALEELEAQADALAGQTLGLAGTVLPAIKAAA